MTSLARVRGLTVEQRVWRFLRRQKAPVVRAVIEAHFGFSGLRAGGILRRLKAKGSVVTSGPHNSTGYAATDVTPEDFRGTAPGTMAVLVKQQVPSRRLHSNRSAPKGRRSPGSPGLALEQAWPAPIR